MKRINSKCHVFQWGCPVLPGKLDVEHLGLPTQLVVVAEHDGHQVDRLCRVYFRPVFGQRHVGEACAAGRKHCGEDQERCKQATHGGALSGSFLNGGFCCIGLMIADEVVPGAAMQVSQSRSFHVMAARLVHVLRKATATGRRRDQVASTWQR
jgi:hypothetical protein